MATSIYTPNSTTLTDVTRHNDQPLACIVNLQARSVDHHVRWAFRLGLVLVTILITGTAVSALFGSEVESPYWAGLGLLAVAGVLLATRRLFDVFGLSAVALGLNTLLVWGLGYMLFNGGGNGDGIGRLVMLGLFAAVLLALTVQGILWRTRQEAA